MYTHFNAPFWSTLTLPTKTRNRTQPFQCRTSILTLFSQGWINCCMSHNEWSAPLPWSTAELKRSRVVYLETIPFCCSSQPRDLRVDSSASPASNPQPFLSRLSKQLLHLAIWVINTKTCIFTKIEKSRVVHLDMNHFVAPRSLRDQRLYLRFQASLSLLWFCLKRLLHIAKSLIGAFFVW